MTAESAELVEETPDIGEEALQQVSSLLQRLIPADTVEIEDIFGNQYRVRAVLPARRQVKVLRHLEKLMQISSTGIDMSEVRQMDVGNIAALFLSLAENDDVLDSLCAAFQEAHPKVVEAAHKAQPTEEKADVADLFPLEEVIGGLVPFFARLASKMMTMVGSMTGPNPAEA